MKFLKTTKGKVVAIFTAILLVSTAGVAFAGSNAGGMLSDWYEAAFAKTTDDAMNEAEAHEEEAAADFEEDYANRKDQKAGQIDRKRDRTTDSSIDNINEAKEGHMDDLDEAQAEILEKMGQDFYNVYMDAWLEIQERAAEAETLVNEDMDQFASEEGEAAIAQLSDDLGEAKEDAVSELEDAIEEAKGVITVELEDRGDNLEENLNGLVDHEIEKLKRIVSDTLYDLTKEQEELIDEAATELEEEAKDAMDEVFENAGE